MVILTFTRGPEGSDNIQLAKELDESLGCSGYSVKTLHVSSGKLK